MFAHQLKAVPLAAAVAAAALAGGLLFATPPAPTPEVPPPAAPVVHVAPQPTPKAAEAKPLPKGPNRIVVWRKGAFVALDPDGANERPLVGDGRQGLHPMMFAVSPDGSRVAVVGPPLDKGDGPLPAHLWLRDRGKDGKVTDLGAAGMARWSGDGTELAISRFTDGTEPADVRSTHEVYNPATRVATPLKLPADHILTDWSRDGRFFLTMKIGPDRDRPLGGVFVMNRDGSERKQLTDAGPGPGLGRFSPDGTRVLLLGGEAQAETDAEKRARLDAGRRAPLPRYNKLTVVDAATGKPTPVADVPLNGELQGFCWSPDGTRIAYVWRETHDNKPEVLADADTTSSLVTCDPDGANQKTVLTATGKPSELTLGGVDWR